MQTFLILNNSKSRIPKQFQKGDVRYPPSLVKYFLELYTKEGDMVIDPFAGLGTTLITSEKMKRVPYGVEQENEKYKYIRNKIRSKDNIKLGDSIDIEKFSIPKCDFSLSSPPYFPMDSGSSIGGDGSYESYIRNIGSIYQKMQSYIKIGGYVVIEVSNMKQENIITQAWDIARVVGERYQFEGEVIVGWRKTGLKKGENTYGQGYDHSYCLVFRNI